MYQKERPVLKSLWKNLSDDTLKPRKIKLEVFLNWTSMCQIPKKKLVVLRIPKLSPKLSTYRWDTLYIFSILKILLKKWTLEDRKSRLPKMWSCNIWMVPYICNILVITQLRITMPEWHRLLTYNILDSIQYWSFSFQGEAYKRLKILIFSNTL